MTRDRYCRDDVTLDTAQAIRFAFDRGDGSTGAVIVDRSTPQAKRCFKPAEPGRSYRSLRPGDVLIVEGVERVITEGPEVWR